MNFINNWQTTISLAIDATSAPLNLPDGLYRLTLADAPAGAVRWEIIDAAVVAGVANLTRGQEATAAQSWPSGSIIYQGLTAGLLTSLLDRLDGIPAGGSGALVGDVTVTARALDDSSLVADGSLVAQADYPSLFTVLGKLGYSNVAASPKTVYADSRRDEYSDLPVIVVGASYDSVIVIAYVHLYGFDDVIVRSADGGETWAQVHTVSTAGGANGNVRGVFGDNDTGQKFYIFGRGASELVSSDGGLTWVAPSAPLLGSDSTYAAYEQSTLVCLGSTFGGEPKSFKWSTDFFSTAANELVLPSNATWATVDGGNGTAYYGTNTGQVFYLNDITGSGTPAEVRKEGGGRLSVSISRSVFFALNKWFVLGSTELMELGADHVTAKVVKQLGYGAITLSACIDEDYNNAALIFTQSGIHSAHMVGGVATEWVKFSNENILEGLDSNKPVPACSIYGFSVFSPTRDTDSTNIRRWSPGYPYDDAVSFKLPNVPAPDGLKAHIRAA